MTTDEDARDIMGIYFSGEIPRDGSQYILVQEFIKREA